VIFPYVASGSLDSNFERPDALGFRPLVFAHRDFLSIATPARVSSGTASDNPDPSRAFKAGSDAPI
jgi:hypothetical protein